MIKAQNKKQKELLDYVEKSAERARGRYAKDYTDINRVKMIYETVGEKQRAYVNKYVAAKGYDVNVINESNYDIKKKEGLQEAFKEVRKALITTKRNGSEVLKTAAQTKQLFQKIENPVHEFGVENYGDISNMELYNRYRYFLQFNKYKQLKKSMSYEDFKKLMAAGGTSSILKINKNIYKKSKEIYNKLQRISTMKPEVFGTSLQSASRSDDGKGDFFGRGNKGFGINEKTVYRKILDILEENKNLSVNEVVDMILKDKDIRNTIRGNVKEMREKFAKMR